MISKGCLVRAKRQVHYANPEVFLVISRPYIEDYAVSAVGPERVIDTLSPSGRVLTFYVDDLEVISEG